MKTKKVSVGVVGPCASGKTTLVNSLRSRGYEAKHIAQEHSYVKDMWKRITNPSILIYLDVSYLNTIKRRKLNWYENEYLEQLHRLEDARKNADIIIDTDDKSSEEVLIAAMKVINLLE